LPVDSVRNLGVIFDKHMSFAQHISAVSKSCFHNIRDLRHIRNTIDQTTACIIARLLVSSCPHFSIIHHPFINAIFLFYFICKCLYEQVVINLFNFFTLYKSPPFHTFIRIHLISLSYHILTFCSLILFLWSKC